MDNSTVKKNFFVFLQSHRSDLEKNKEPVPWAGISRVVVRKIHLLDLPDTVSIIQDIK